MNGILKRFVALAAVALLWSSQASAVIIVIEDDIGAGGVSTGETFTITVWATDVPTGEAVSAYDLDILFDTILTASNLVFGPLNLLGMEFLFEVLNDFDLSVDGVIDAAQLSFLSDDQLFVLQGGEDVALFTVDLTVGDGVDDAFFDFDLSWDDSNDVKCDLAQICAPVGVPEPGTLALIGLGLFGMAASRRRRKI